MANRQSPHLCDQSDGVQPIDAERIRRLFEDPRPDLVATLRDSLNARPHYRLPLHREIAEFVDDLRTHPVFAFVCTAGGFLFGLSLVAVGCWIALEFVK